MQIDRPSRRRLFSLLLFFTLIILLIYQFRRLSVDWQGYNMGEYVRQNTEFDALLFLLTILLMPINWSLETWQWLRLMRYKSPLSFRKAFSCVLAGISVSMFTPNRVGEFAGRLLLLSSNRRSEVIAGIKEALSPQMKTHGNWLLESWKLYLFDMIETA